MKPSSNTLLAMLFCASLLAGCAATGATPAGSAESSAATPSDTPTNQAPAAPKKKSAAGGAEPECD